MGVSATSSRRGWNFLAIEAICNARNLSTRHSSYDVVLLSKPDHLRRHRVDWHWTTNGYLAGLVGFVAAYGATLALSYITNLFKTNRTSGRF
jgi:hypothetical protein